MDGWIDRSIDRLFFSDEYLSGSAVEHDDPSRDALVDQLRYNTRQCFVFGGFQGGGGETTHDKSSGKIACTGSVRRYQQRKQESPNTKIKTLQYMA